MAYLAQLHNHREHGGRFEYRSILTDVLGLVIERAAGRPFADTLGRELWSPAVLDATDVADRCKVLAGDFWLSCRVGGDSSVRELDMDASAAEVDHGDEGVG